MFLLLFPGLIPSVFFFPPSKLLTRQLAQIWLPPCSTIKSIDWDSWGRGVWNCTPPPPSSSQNCPSRETQSITFEKKIYRRLIKQAEVGFSAVSQVILQTLQSMQPCGGYTTSSPSEAGWFLGERENVWPTACSKTIICGVFARNNKKGNWTAVEYKEPRAKSQHAQGQRSLRDFVINDQVDFLFRQIGFNAAGFMPCFFFIF